jgi:lipoic acid synthetase
MSTSDRHPPRRRLPAWLKKRIPVGGQAGEVDDLLAGLNLHTVCQGAHCPNQCECFSRGTATFLILGEVCTRGCTFCAIPCEKRPPPPRDEEPGNVAEAAARLGLRHVVVTSVTRDDLSDGGAGHFARTLRALRERLGESARLEVLTPDFLGDAAAVETVIAAGADVFNHNVETVPRLYPRVRPQADYARSLKVLRLAGEIASRLGSDAVTKSGLMVGLGETTEEIEAVLADLRRSGVEIVTIGQYLAPSTAHVPVAEFIEPATFDALAETARRMGFSAVAAGPFVRSSYQAEEVFRRAGSTRRR